MLAGIIKEKDNNYYINLNNEDKTISIIHSNRNKTKCLTEEEAIYLLEKILSSNLTYKEKYNDYDVYLDEANNKRYFKDGTEDFKMFFYNNGINYIKYKLFDKNNISKLFRINKEETIFVIIIGIAAILLIPEYRYKFIDSIYSNEITYDTAKELIMDSENLTIEDKIYLCNEDFLNDVINVSNSNRNYSLREKLNNIKINNYEEEDKPHTLGYYSSLEPNVIYMREDIIPDNFDSYKDTLSHEFVHLLQNESEYLYIHEASAELLSYEYYNDKVNSYEEEVLRLRVLMEIIGPQPILECNFSENDSSFEKAIKEYLEEDDAKRLLELFKSCSDDFYDQEKETKINNEVDSLLSTMYFNKYNKDINNDELIKAIYKNNYSIKRYYFNQNKEGFSEEITLNRKNIELDKISIDEVINSDKVKEYTYTDTKYLTEEEYNKITMEELTTYDTMSVVYKPLNVITIEIDKDNKTMYTANGINYTQEEALKEGYLEKIFVLSRSKTVDKFEDIELDKCDSLKITFKNGTYGETTHNKDMNTWGSVIRYKIDYTTEPSIKEKFKDQFSDTSSKNIEILDIIEENAKNDKSEVKLI